ncbi:alpha/beta fold hydrolase [Kitasatospora camelliae]|uniref:Alpha/beta fold hydrolase n=1 Tax=Kitasatospora camelliae TaxID=3156397 RepID=A0AAU8K2L1_9ACTN
MSTDTFEAAYDALLARWPAGTEAREITTPYGPTRVHSHGPADGEPLVLLHGGGATSVSWYANAGALATRYRVHAVDILGDAGRSRREGLPLRTAEDLTRWLDAVLDGLGLPRVHLAGHSYGAWLAATYALHAPGRVAALALIDPTQCFTGYRPGYLLHALPMLLRRTRTAARAFLAWETRGTGLPEEFARLYELGVAEVRARPVVGRRAEVARLRGPVLVLFAGRSRTHDAGKAAARARRLLPHARVEVLPGVTHHSVPMAGAERIDRCLLELPGQAALGSSL